MTEYRGGRQRTTTGDYGRLRTTADDYRRLRLRLRTTTYDYGRLRTTEPLEPSTYRSGAFKPVGSLFANSDPTVFKAPERSVTSDRQFIKRQRVP